MIIIQFYTVSQTSLAKTSSSIVEYPIMLWFADGSQTSTNVTNTTGSCFLGDGGGDQNASTSSSTKLHTLNSNWSATQKFAFEATLYLSVSGYTAYSALWDFTASAVVASSQVSTSSTTATVLRSSQFTLIPGRQYGVVVWESNSTPLTYIIDASLIVFGS